MRKTRLGKLINVGVSEFSREGLLDSLFGKLSKVAPFSTDNLKSSIDYCLTDLEKHKNRFSELYDSSIDVEMLSDEERVEATTLAPVFYPVVGLGMLEGKKVKLSLEAYKEAYKLSNFTFDSNLACRPNMNSSLNSKILKVLVSNGYDEETPDIKDCNVLLLSMLDADTIMVGKMKDGLLDIDQFTVNPEYEPIGFNDVTQDQVAYKYYTDIVKEKDSLEGDKLKEFSNFMVKAITEDIKEVQKLKSFLPKVNTILNSLHQDIDKAIASNDKEAYKLAKSNYGKARDGYQHTIHNMNKAKHIMWNSLSAIGYIYK